MKIGYLVEITFINYLNNSLYKELNPIMQDLLRALYPYIKDNDKIIAYKYGKYAKVDVVIIVRGIKKGISIKSGSKNSVHLEKINKFSLFLLKNKFTNIIELKNKFTNIIELKKYLYSDGTINNTGKYRLTADEYKKNNIEEIKEINRELNKIKEILIKRFLIKTDINYKVSVNAFIYGYVNDFLWATTEEVIECLMEKDVSSTGVHLSSLFIQNWDKNIKQNEKYEYCREYIQVKWYSIFDDFIYIMNKRVEPQADCVKHKKKNSVITKFLNYIWSG